MSAARGSTGVDAVEAVMNENSMTDMPGLETVETEHGPLSIDEHTAELDSFATGICGLRTIMVNLFAIQDLSGWVLVDTGLPGSKGRVHRWAVETHGSQRPQAILLTHGHFDHTGAVVELAREWNVPVYVHELEMPYVTRQREYPGPYPSVGGGIMSVLSPFYPKKSADLSGMVSVLPANGSVPGLPSWRWVHTPGHTEGHVSFFRESDGVLIAGDAVTTTKQESFWAVVRQKGELHGPPAYFTNDWDAAERSVQKLAGLRPKAIAAGHGKPLAGELATAGLTELASNFKSLARPHPESR
ncbi:MAG: MBL fold metallo-hydrolase [Acidobacteriaceae bacterium]|nr:MBL fold metallo-hydrolase [Acidobacteriaceae bacterium]